MCGKLLGPDGNKPLNFALGPCRLNGAVITQDKADLSVSLRMQRCRWALVSEARLWHQRSGACVEAHHVSQPAASLLADPAMLGTLSLSKPVFTWYPQNCSDSPTPTV